MDACRCRGAAGRLRGCCRGAAGWLPGRCGADAGRIRAGKGRNPSGAAANRRARGRSAGLFRGAVPGRLNGVQLPCEAGGGGALLSRRVGCAQRRRGAEGQRQVRRGVPVPCPALRPASPYGARVAAKAEVPFRGGGPLHRVARGPPPHPLRGRGGRGQSPLGVPGSAPRTGRMRAVADRQARVGCADGEEQVSRRSACQAGCGGAGGGRRRPCRGLRGR